MDDSDRLRFPSNRSIGNCRKDAKRYSRLNNVLLSQAQDAIAKLNGATLPWNQAIAAIKKGTAKTPEHKTQENTGSMSLADISAVMTRYPDLSNYGFGVPRERVKTSADYESELKRMRSDPIALDQCNLACRFLQFVDKRKSINERVGTSYGLKHEAEYYLARLVTKLPAGSYMSNGAFICAAIHMGFEFRRYDGRPNACFNMSSKSLVFEWRKLRERGLYFSPARERRRVELAAILQAKYD